MTHDDADLPEELRREIEAVCEEAGRALTHLLRAVLFLFARRKWGRPEMEAALAAARDADFDVNMTEVYAILSERFDSGDRDVAASQRAPAVSSPPAEVL